MTRSRLTQLKVWFPRIAACAGALGVCAASCMMATGSLTTLSGCIDDDAGITLDDVSGIIVQSESLFAPVGCGTGPSQVYRYIGVADYPPDRGARTDDGGIPFPGAIVVTPCYADATFNVPSSTLFYHLRVYAFSYAAYQALGGSDAPLLNTGGLDSALRALSPTYLTTCATKEQVNVEVLAVCTPLTYLDGGVLTVVDDEDAAATLDAGDAGDGSSDAGDAADAADASLADADADAGDASGNDAD
jgi:hypothetical protein